MIGGQLEALPEEQIGPGDSAHTMVDALKQWEWGAPSEHSLL